MDKVYITFWICVATVIISIIAAMTFNNYTTSVENDPRMACIKEHGDWNSWNNSCSFTPQKETK
jgi:hypothetical protein